MKMLALVMSLLAATTALAAQPTKASAARKPRTTVSSPLNPGDVYLVEWYCTERKAPRQGDFVTALFSALGWTSTWQGFGIYFTKGDATAAKENSSISNVADLLDAQIVYIVEKGGTSKSLFNTKCRGQLLLRGSDDPHLQVFRGEATVTTNVLEKLSSFLGKAVDPFYSILTGLPLPEKGKQILQKSRDVLDAYRTDILPLFNTNAAETRSMPLEIGEHPEPSPFADVNIRVSKPESLLLSRAPFKDAVSSMISVTGKPAASDLEPAKLGELRGKCNGVLQQWKAAGIRNDVDRAYVMYRSISDAATSRDVILRCLGRFYALAALPYQGKRHFDVPEEYKYTADDIENMYPNDTTNPEFGIQPQGWGKLGETIRFVGERAGRELKGSQADSFNERFDTTLRVEDETFDYKILKSIDPANPGVSFEGSPTDVFAKLRKAGFGSWSCVGLTDTAAASPYKSSDRREAVLALVSQVVDGKELPQPKAIRILFKDKKIRSLVFTDYFDAGKYAKAVCADNPS